MTSTTTVTRTAERARSRAAERAFGLSGNAAPRPKSQGLHGQRGFTLVELLAVIAIVGVLAGLAVTGFQTMIRRSKDEDTKQALLGVAAAINAYYARTQGYLNCSTSGTSFYPMAPSDKKHGFRNSTNPDHLCWDYYGIDITPTHMSFTVQAGTAGQNPPQPLKLKNLTWPTPKGPWFVLVGATDHDVDGTLGLHVVSSFAPGEVITENMGD